MSDRSGLRVRRGLLIFLNAGGLALLVVYLFGLHRIPRPPDIKIAHPGWPTNGSSVAALIVDRENLEMQSTLR